MTAEQLGAVTACSLVVLGMVMRELPRQIERARARRRLVRRSPIHRLQLKREGVLTQRRACVVFIGLAATAAFLLDGVGLTIIVLFATVTTAMAIGRWRSRRSIALYEQSLLQALDSTVRSLRSGAGLVAALRDVSATTRGPVVADIDRVVQEVDMGTGLDIALHRWADRVNLRSVRLTVASMALTYETGASTVSSIESVTATTRNALAAEASARVQATQARASATTLAVLPFVVSTPMLVFNEPARAFMLHTPPGLGLLVAGLLLDVVGLWCMTRLVERSQL